MLRIPAEMLGQLDEARKREDDLPTRPEMIRRILAEWLMQECPND
ncbi:ribbon-helix-helix protein, CopG family [Yangia sp. PrR004]|nr:ribbon-helix-helix protein, CopG family [Salipiger sp. PrR004]